MRPGGEGLAISDATLGCLRAVRLTVGDSGQAQRIIQTQRGYGYRFVADLALLPEDPSLLPVSLDSPHCPRWCQTFAPVRPATTPIRQRPPLCGVWDALAPPCAHCGQDILLPAAFCPACGQPRGVPSPPGPVASMAAVPGLSQTVVTPPDQSGFGADA